MPLMNEFKKERESVKNGPLKQRAAYFWDYHKWHVFLALIIVVFVTNLIYNFATEPEIILNGVLLNSTVWDSENSSADLGSTFLTEQNIDTAEYAVHFNNSLYYIAAEPSKIISSNYQTMQTILTQSAVDKLDFLTADLNSMIDLAYKDLFWDLTDILNKEQQALYEPYFCYIDMTVVRELDEVNARNEDVSYIEYPDHTKPEAMVEPVPVLIDMSQSETLSAAYNNAYDALAIGIMNDTNLKTMLLFIDYLMQ